MTSLTLTVEELQQLDALIGNVPTKFGLPIVQFFQLVQQKRKLIEEKKVLDSKITKEKILAEVLVDINNCGNQEQGNDKKAEIDYIF